MYRLFVALRPPPEVRAWLLDTMGGVPGARWQDDEQLHLTLHFIGEVERIQAEDVAAALGSVVAPTPQVKIAGVGRFANALWAGVAPHDELAHLHRKVDRALVMAGLEPERRAYLPHVTLARMSRSVAASPAVDRWLAGHAAMASAPFALPHLVLYDSTLARDGASYEPVARWPLAMLDHRGDTAG